MELQPVPMLLVIMLAFAVITFLYTRYAAQHAHLLAASLAAHGLSAWLNLWLVLEVYGFGDVLMYQYFGSDLADALRDDFLRVFPGAIWVFLQQDNPLSVFVPAEGSDVASMVVLSGFTNLLLDNSLLATSFAFALASFCGKLVLLQAFFESAPRRLHTALVIGTMLVPSSVFWSSGIIKEAVAVPAIGLFLLGLVRVSNRRLGSLPMVGVGLVLLGLVKAYLVIVVIGATGAYVYAARAFQQGRVKIRPVALVVGGALIIGGMLVVGEVYPQFSLDRLAQETARLQSASLNPQGGSTYAIGDPSAQTTLGQLVHVPMALLTGIYRPFLFEARNVQMAINGLETAAFLGLTVFAVWRRPPSALWRTVLQYPVLTFCISFVLVCGVATGLTAVNLGTLSRYRMPLVPFLATTLVLLIGARQARGPRYAASAGSAGSGSGSGSTSSP